MRSSKWHALGNVYLLVEQAELRPEQVRELVGDADGIVEVVSTGADVADVVIWNPDGSTAEMSGNGTRIAARWLAQKTGADELRVRVGSREVRARIRADGSVEQDMGRFTIGEREQVEGVTFVPVDTGNPHAVVEGDPEDIGRVGPLLETHPRFSDRTNVQVARVDGEGEVTARVWERGVGETTSSGTSAVAVAAACVGSGSVTVHFPGGDFQVRLEDDRAFLVGTAEELEA
jgi:diaminopimelate epimerase